MKGASPRKGDSNSWAWKHPGFASEGGGRGSGGVQEGPTEPILDLLVMPSDFVVNPETKGEPEYSPRPEYR
eukprot:149876-Prorocentrum_minimum.AAC.1